MPNYKSRDNVPKDDDDKKPKKSGGSLMTDEAIGGALQALDEYEFENPKDAPSAPSYDDYYRDASTQLDNIVDDASNDKSGGSLHGRLIFHLLKKLKPSHFQVIRHTARMIKNGLHGGKLDDDLHGAIGDISNAKDIHHLADMIENDYHLNSEEDDEEHDQGGGLFKRPKGWYRGRGKERFLKALKSVGKLAKSVPHIAMKVAPVAMSVASILKR